VLKIFGVDRQGHNPDQYYTPEELQFIVQESEELGALRVESGQMLQELFEFGDRTAGEVMVPRVRVTGLPLGTTPAQVRESLGRSPHTRYPVYEGDLDHILGMVHIKDLLGVLLRNEAIARSHVRPLPLVPETAELDSVLSTMRRERTQMVIVLDEHGGTAGVVTLQDLFEEVVGDIEEGPANAPHVYRDAEGRLHVPGTMRIDELGQEFGLELEHEDVDSVSGLVLTLLGRPPVVSDTVRYDRLLFNVTAVKGHGVDECAVSLRADTV
jgi:CBS domain containing-hemolysin-like protein